MKTQLLIMWVSATALALAALPFVIAVLTVHHATRSAGDGRGLHDGDI